MLLILLTIILGLLLLLDNLKRRYWTNKGVPVTNDSIPFFGHFLPVVLQKQTALGVYEDAYKKLNNSPYFGVYEFWRPCLVVTDLKLIEQIVIKDFSSFLDHTRWVFDVRSILHESLFNMTGNRWRALRYQMIPWFTTGRMKSLFPHVLNSIKIPEVEFEAKNYLRLFTEDTISAFFGVEVPDKETFHKMNGTFHDVSNLRYYKLLMVEHFSKFTDAVGITFADHATDSYFRNFIKAVLRNNNSNLIQRLRKILNEGKVHMRKKDLYKKSSEDEVLTYDVTEDVIVGIAGQFLIGGLDTTSNTMVWLLYDLAMNPEVQIKARDEIRRTLEKHGGWKYEALQDMRYVANCVHESMRLHPTLPFMLRSCTTTFKTKDGLTIDKGTKLVIPGLTIHMNPDIYPEPEKFKPERFGDIEKHTNLTWLPFGEGSRKCAGMRFSQMEMKIMVAKFLVNHEIVFTENTTFPIVNDDRRFLGRPLNDIYMKLNRLD